jgi:hypothetical protein
MATKGGPRIVDDLSNLKIHLDGGNPKLKGSGRGLKRGLNRGTNIDDTSIHLDELDATDENNTERFTLITWIEVNAYNTGYAWHPVNKWNGSGTNSATIVLYAFQDYRAGGGGSVGDGLGNDDHNRYGFYWHRYDAGGWAGYAIYENDSILGGLENRNNFPRKNFFAFAYDKDLNSSQPKIYCNGQLMGSGAASPNGIGNYTHSQGDLFINTSYAANGVDDNNGATFLQVYDRMLSDDEVIDIYNTTKQQHGY